MPKWPRMRPSPALAGTSKHGVMTPPLSDERATIVRASAALKKGDNVVIAGGIAKPIARRLIGVGQDDQLGRALEDASAGDAVRV